MPLRRILHLSCLVLPAFCIGFGYGKFGPGLAFGAGILTLGMWFLVHKWPSTWLTPVALIVNVFLAVIGLSQGASALLMLAVTGFALVNWDLSLLGRIPTDSWSIQKMTLHEKKHYQSLLLTLGLAFPMIIMGRMIHLPIPFGIMALVVIAAFLGIGRVWTLFSK